MAGSFRLSQVRIPGEPVINVASLRVAGPEAGPDAAERARVIEGNLDLLWRPPPQPCTPGERIGELLLERTSVGAAEAVCDPDYLGLWGAPGALRVVVQRQAGGLNQLAAVVPGRATPFPLLTVSAAGCSDGSVVPVRSMETSRSPPAWGRRSRWSPDSRSCCWGWRSAPWWC